MNKAKQPELPARRLTARQREARKIRRKRMERIYLLSLQDLPVEKFEKAFDRIAQGKLRLVGLEEKPNQHSRWAEIVVEETVG